jgi:GNAT superfamily N-acetyltransferase
MVQEYPKSEAAPEVIVRPARLETDTASIAALLAEAFPSLYRTTFGDFGTATWAAILESLYAAGTLTLAQTRVAERNGKIVGLCILHTGVSIAHNGARNYWRALRCILRLPRTIRAWTGGIFGHAVMNGRIPRAPDLAYVEALAVAEAERGHGIGTLLLRDALAWTQETGRKRLALHVLESNTIARNLYTREGFRLWEPPPFRPGLFGGRSSHSFGALLLIRSV